MYIIYAQFLLTACVIHTFAELYIGNEISKHAIIYILLTSLDWDRTGAISALGLFWPRCARSILSRLGANILPVRPSRLINKTNLLHYWKDFINRRGHCLVGLRKKGILKDGVTVEKIFKCCSTSNKNYERDLLSKPSLFFRFCKQLQHTYLSGDFSGPGPIL